jgi:hypothetical protein
LFFACWFLPSLSCVFFLFRFFSVFWFFGFHFSKRFVWFPPRSYHKTPLFSGGWFLACAAGLLELRKSEILFFCFLVLFWGSRESARISGRKLIFREYLGTHFEIL